MNERDPALEYCWRSNGDDSLIGFEIEYTPYMGERDAFVLKTPLGSFEMEGLNAVRGLHAMLGKAIEKAEEIPPHA